MTPEEIRSSIMTELNDNWTKTPISWPNREFSSSGTAFIEPTILMGDSFELEKGDNGVGLRTGVFMINVYALPGSGNGVPLGYAGSLETIFRRKNVDEIFFEEPSTYEIGQNGNYYQVAVSIPFSCWIGE